MIRKLSQNPTIQIFCTNDLKKEETFNKKTVILVSNYAFLLRVLAIHLVIVGIPLMPQF